MSSRYAYIPVGEAKQGMGGGMNSGVVLVKHRANHLTYIEKRIPTTLVVSGDAECEVHAMRQVMQRSGVHPNIVFVVDFDLNFQGLGYGSIFMQYCELGSLDTLMMRYMDHGKYLADEGFVWKVLWDISLALCFLWTGNDDASTRQLAKAGISAPIYWTWNYIFHCDLKPSNIFLTWADYAGVNEGSSYPTVVLGDFGCSISQDDINGGVECIGDLDFEAPEAPRASWANDVYGLGLIIHCLVLMTLKPYYGRDSLENFPFLDEKVSRSLEYLVGRCLSEDPLERPMPQDLPKLVWSGFLAWRVGRDDVGTPLPNWALYPSY